MYPFNTFDFDKLALRILIGTMLLNIHFTLGLRKQTRCTYFGNSLNYTLLLSGTFSTCSLYRVTLLTFTSFREIL